MLTFHVLTLFPDLFSVITEAGITGKAREKGLYACRCYNPRDQVEDVHRTVDDRPYGGGPGMVMLYQPLADTWKQVTQTCGADRPHLVYLSPQGKPLTQQRVKALTQLSNIALLCGRYEGVDERFIEAYVDEEVSVGDFVVSGGELPAMLLMDAVVRLLPGALGHHASAEEDSFSEGLLDCPHYTRPPEIEGRGVPEVLQSGNHAHIALWRRQQQLLRTAKRRPELLSSVSLTEKEQGWLNRQLLEAAQ